MVGEVAQIAAERRVEPGAQRRRRRAAAVALRPRRAELRLGHDGPAEPGLGGAVGLRERLLGHVLKCKKEY